jgi:hypothetical protein
VAVVPKDDEAFVELHALAHWESLVLLWISPHNAGAKDHQMSLLCAYFSLYLMLMLYEFPHF